MEGFVVICICRGEDDSVAIRMKLISRDDDDWTIDLASWYLAMLALNEDHRAIKLCKETPLLNNWRRVGEKRKNIYVEHPISRRRFRHLKDIPGDIELVWYALLTWTNLIVGQNVSWTLSFLLCIGYEVEPNIYQELVHTLPIAAISSNAFDNVRVRKGAINPHNDLDTKRKN